MARILLIEPDRVLAETYSLALIQAGHQVAACASAQAGVLVADQFQPELVILELQLITHSGIEFLYEFRSYPDWQDIPVIIHSMVVPREFNRSRQLLQAHLGVSQYLYKPQTSLQQLLRTINSQLVVAA